MSKPGLRKCIGCGQIRESSLMLRIVRCSDGLILMDPNKKISGRGAYLCRNPECAVIAGKRKGLERSLKCSVNASVYEDLINECES